MKILVVEDEADIRENIADVLELEGFHVEQAVNGLNGIEKAVEFKPNLIISDISMPKLDGPGFFKRLHEEHPEISEVPFLFLTAHADRDSELKGRKLGASDYLTKPVDFDLLIARVNGQLITQEKVMKQVSRKLHSALENTTAGRALLTGNYESGVFEDLLSRYQTVIDAEGDRTVAISCVREATFAFRTTLEAKCIAVSLARIFPSPETASMGLVELMINAIEHGNLGLTYKDKSRLLKANGWPQEIERRLKSPEYSGKKAIASIVQTETEIQVTVEDQGDGFDYTQFLELSDERSDDLHGRGIAFAKQLSFDTLEYKGKGNIVTVSVKKPA